MEKIDLQVEERTLTGKKVKHLRSEGIIPAVVYGHDLKAIALSVNTKQYAKAIGGDAGTNVIISLNVAGKKGEAIPVISHEIQRDALTDEILHVDFHKINMKEKIRTKIPIEIVGVAIGVKEEAGIFVHSLTELEIECLPMDIPDMVKVDVSALKIGDSLYVSDLRKELVSEITILTPETEPIAQVVEPTKEEEVVAEPVEGEVPVDGKTPADGTVSEVEGDAKKEDLSAGKAGGAKTETK